MTGSQTRSGLGEAQLLKELIDLLFVALASVGRIYFDINIFIYIYTAVDLGIFKEVLVHMVEVQSVIFPDFTVESDHSACFTFRHGTGPVKFLIFLYLFEVLIEYIEIIHGIIIFFKSYVGIEIIAVTGIDEILDVVSVNLIILLMDSLFFLNAGNVR